jgi:hypothetical protein
MHALVLYTSDNDQKGRYIIISHDPDVPDIKSFFI